MPESVSPLLPIGAGRAIHRIWPGSQARLTVTASGMTTNVAGRPGAGPDYSAMSAVSYGGGVTVGAIQNNIDCYDLQATGGGTPTGSAAAFTDNIQVPVGQFAQPMPATLSLSCMRVLALMKGAFVADAGGDVGIQICQGGRFPSFTIFNDFTPGIQFGPRGPARASLRVRFAQAGGLTLDLDVAAAFMATINPNAWNLWEVRILGASNQSNAAIKCLCNGIQVVPTQVIDAAAVIPGPWYVPNNSTGYTFGAVNRGDSNSPHLYVDGMEFMAGPNETSLL